LFSVELSGSTKCYSIKATEKLFFLNSAQVLFSAFEKYGGVQVPRVTAKIKIVFIIPLRSD
jgi:hypothetical protein